MRPLSLFGKKVTALLETSTTLVVAISKLAASLGCTVDFCKITRCSNTYATLADHLSKANFNHFHALAGQQNITFPVEPAWIPPSLIKWIENPTEDDNLGDDIL